MIILHILLWTGNVVTISAQDRFLNLLRPHLQTQNHLLQIGDQIGVGKSNGIIRGNSDGSHQALRIVRIILGMVSVLKLVDKAMDFHMVNQVGTVSTAQPKGRSCKNELPTEFGVLFSSLRPPPISSFSIVRSSFRSLKKLPFQKKTIIS